MDSNPPDPAALAATAWATLTPAQKKAIGAAFDPTDLANRAELAVANATDLPDDQVLAVATGRWDPALGPDRQVVAACNEALARDLTSDSLADQVDRIRAWRQSAIQHLATSPDPDQRFSHFVPAARAVYSPRAAVLAAPTTDQEQGRAAACELWMQASLAGPSRHPSVMDAWLKHHLVFIHGRGTPYNRAKAASFNDELLRIKLVIATWDR